MMANDDNDETRKNRIENRKKEDIRNVCTCSIVIIIVSFHSFYSILYIMTQNVYSILFYFLFFIKNRNEQ